MHRRIALVVVISLVVISPLLLGFAAPASAAISARPFKFVGTAAECGGPAGARVVTAAWLGGIGLPDDGSPNFNASNPADLPAKTNPRLGLLLSKNSATPVCAAAGAQILGFATIVVDAGDELGYDLRNGSHCSGGAPRFNVSWNLGGTTGFTFVGACGAPGSVSPATQDPAEWTTHRFNLVLAGVPPGATLTAITIIFDEGTDTPSPATGDAGGIGLAIIDNIFIAGQVIPKGGGVVD